MPPTTREVIDRLEGVSLEELDERASLRRRVDRKYLLPPDAFERILADLSGCYDVLEIDGHRSFRYESVYFDAPDLRCFTEHVEGAAPRFKARSRLYRDTNACFFEAKMKTTEGRTVKRQLDIGAEQHGELTDEQRDFLTASLEDCEIEPPERLEPSLTTRFRRITLVSGSTPERVTADLGVELRVPDGRGARIRGERVLVETKSEGGDGPFDDALASAGFDSISLSKYRTGIALLEAPDPGNPLGDDLERVFDANHRSAGTARPLADASMEAAGETTEGTEIERKFLLDRLPGHVSREPGEPIRQGYLALDGDTEVRLRLKGDERSLTVKHGRGRVRVEEAVGLDQRQARALWALTGGRRLEKTRRRVGLGELVADVDEYMGDLAGLRVAEVEFADEAAADRFEPPDWFGREVTADDAFSARSLACGGPPEPRG